MTEFLSGKSFQQNRTAEEILTSLQSNQPILGRFLEVLLSGGELILLDPWHRCPFEVAMFRRVANTTLLNGLQAGDLVLEFETSAAELSGVHRLKLNDFDANFAVLREWNLLLETIAFSKNDFRQERPRVNPGLFLDRDGVIIDAVEYISKPEDVRLRKGIVETLKKAREKNYKIVVITNQSGLGRGIFNWSDYDAVNCEMMNQLAKAGVWIDAVECAPFQADSAHFWAKLYREKRKPGQQMLETLSQKHGIDFSKSTLIGDRWSDIEAGSTAKIPRLFLVESHDSKAQENLANSNQKSIVFTRMSEIESQKIFNE